MIIDCHAHLMTLPSLFAIRTVLDASNGQHAKEWYRKRWMAEDDVPKAAANLIAIMDKVGTDIQCLSPRPFTLWHSHRNPSDIDIWVGLQNDIIYETTQLYPDRFRGVCGLPQWKASPIERVFPELERCVKDLGFIGAMVNPDPGEGGGESPRLGDPYWYPLWEKCIELDVPVHIHSASCCGRETYDEHFSSEESLAITSVIHSQLFDRYPELKMMISHGGGSIPYQIGRWRSHWQVEQCAKNPHIARFVKDLEAAGRAREPLPKPPADLSTFDDELKRFWFDCAVHARESLELLFKVVGADRVLFGTERPGSGGGIDLSTGRPMDDFKFTLGRMESLSDADRKKVYEGNARKMFPRLKA